MSPLPDAKLKIVRALVEQAPDKAVSTLLMALSSDSGLDAGLIAVRAVVEVEARERRTRATVFAPISALCARGRTGRLAFPPKTLGRLWTALKLEAPDRCEAAHHLVAEWDAETSRPDLLDDLCRLAGRGLADGRNGEFIAAAALADEGSGAGTLSRCLELAAITRRSIARLPDWLGRVTDEKAALLRLAFKDVAKIAPDSEPLFFESLAANLAEPWRILHIIAMAMARPSDTYLASTELAGFGEDLLADIDSRLDLLKRFTRDAGADGARATAEALHVAVQEIVEFERSLNLSPEGVWGRRLIAQRRTLAAAAEAHLRAVDDAMSHALPLQTVRLGPRTLKGIPRLTAEPDPKMAERAITLLTLLQETRVSAAAGGFASARSKALEIAEARLDEYIDDTLHDLRAEAPREPERARAFLEVAAQLSAVLRDDKAAQLVRRRAAAA
ncbi:hypothetical protein ACO2Q3_05095 [Caulobacter sp. KR2-114]|uniref:hypothetical protein n=1 Tax=Caulobacter sp. KR2-114 TaxID=3400912 RepID=UPI003C12981C